jgi:hypothetical protein
MSFNQYLLVFLALGAALTSLWARSWAMSFVAQQQVSSDQPS